MTTKLDTRLTLEEANLAAEIAANSGVTDIPYLGTLGALLALPIGEVTLAAARDQLAVAVLERTSERAPGSLRQVSSYVDPDRLSGIDAVLAAQGLEINGVFIAEPAQRLQSVRLLIDTAAGLAAQHFRPFGVQDVAFRVEHPPARAGQWRLQADLRSHGNNMDIAQQFGDWLDTADRALARRIEIEADGFEITFWAASKAEIEATRQYFYTFARATFLHPLDH